MRSLQDGHDTPPGGSIGSILGGGDQPIPPGLDVRRGSSPMIRPTPMGPTYAVDVQEILKRGFKTLDQDEQAAVIAGYLATQKQQLSPFLTPFDEELARSKLIIESSRTKERRWTKIFGGIFLVVGVSVLLWATIKTALNKGMMADSGSVHGFLSMFQEIIRVIFNSGSF